VSVHLFLYAVAAAALWLGSLYVHPFGRCLRCRGRRVVIRGTKRKPRPVRCPVCKGHGRRQRLGSRTVHQLVCRVRRELARQRQARLAERTLTRADRNL